MTRLERLRKRIRSSEPGICTERALLVTESYRETEGEPMVIRRAKALDKVLSKMTIRIYDDELIVGNQSSGLLKSPIFPEFSAIDSPLAGDGDKALLEEVYSYWRGKTVLDGASGLRSSDELEAERAGLYISAASKMGIGHIIVDYEKVLRDGFNGIRDEVEEKLGGMTCLTPRDAGKKDFLRSIIVICQAVEKFAHRYAEEARRLAELEVCSWRKVELEKIAEICDLVRGNPARTFHEALQSFWFTHLISQIESTGVAYSPGRFDQYMYPFYRRDLIEGRIAREGAQELVGCLWIKFNEINMAADDKNPDTAAGQGMFQNLILGGQRPDGQDATNELTQICLETTARLKVVQPSLSFRWHPAVPEEIFLQACEVIKSGIGLPAVFNDEVIIPAMVAQGIPPDDARNYGIVGCVELAVPGKEYSWIMGNINLPKCLELALNDGICLLSGKRIGPGMGDPTRFNSFDDVLKAFEAQVQNAVQLYATSDNIANLIQAEVVPLPYLSAITNDCIERMQDINSGGARYNFSSPSCVGIANVADSLAAIKKLVFEQEILTMHDLRNALATDFEGKEDLRQLLIKRAPKYGNDDDYVDSIARYVAGIFCREVRKHCNPRGGVFQPGIYPVTAHMALGEMVGASPEGRRARMPLAEGISPVQGRDVKGPTAALKSVSKVCHTLFSGGTLLNQKYHPTALSGQEGTKLLAALIKSYFVLGGMEIQINVVGREILMEAKKNPDEYRDLIVRVAGYSSYFITLNPELQDEIISRTEHVAV